MKVKRLIEILETLSPELRVIVSADAEGNSFRLVEDYSCGRYDQREHDFTQSCDLDEDSKVNAVCIWPG
jgi:hypothetical protein